MSEKMPNTNNGFDWTDPGGEEFDFPGTGRDDLTEEEKEFTFDEDYLDGDFPPAKRPAPEPEDASAELDAIASAIRNRQKKGDQERRDHEERIDAVFDAFKKRTGKKEERQEPPSGEKEDEVFDAFRKLARRDGQSASAPVPAEPAGRKLPARRQRRRSEQLEPAPVTVGRALRADQMLVYDSELDEIDYTDPDDLPEMRDYMPIRFRRYSGVGIGGGILYALFVISISVVLACMGWLFAADVLALNKEPKASIVTIDEYVPEGDDPILDDEGNVIQVDIDQVADELKRTGMIEYKWLFKLFSQFSHASTKIDPGTYDVSTELDYRALVTALQFGSGNQEITRVTFPEGYSMEQIFTLLEENHICHKHELYDAAANYEFDYDFLEGLETGDPNRLEGFLFPDTYDFYQGEDASVSINRFLHNLDNKLSDEIRSAAANRGLSIKELLTIASFIEKEAGSDEERGTMASVIYNRLNSGMPLQLDSTLNYIKGTSTFDLTIADTEIDDPYNTYMYTGLTPGPICNPGLASIQAAAEPESTNYWYWYSVDGVSTFFTDYDEFNAFANEHPIN